MIIYVCVSVLSIVGFMIGFIQLSNFVIKVLIIRISATFNMEYSPSSL